MALFVALFITIACNISVKERPNEIKKKREGTSDGQLSINSNHPEDTVVKVKTGAWKTLVDIQTINPNIFVDLKYASTDNFMKMKLYDTITKAYLQKDVAIRLGKCQDYLKTLDPTLSLLVYDCVRPISVQYKMWKALDTIPVKQRTKFVSNPANGSIHNYGAAVDLTLCDKNGVALDMGAGYDDIRKIAYPSMENHYLSTGELTKQQVSNREMLRKVMKYQNFSNISTEWWHFNACSRNTAKAKYIPLK
jgi:zinc D-Ala-D-Ala dipeptidase